MFFDKECLMFQILDVVNFKTGPSSGIQVKRDFDCLSFRFSADAVITTQKGSRVIGDHHLCYFPAGITYTRESLYEDLIAVYFHAQNYTSGDLEVFITENPELFKRLFRELLTTWRGHRAGYQYECAALLNTILGECYKENLQLNPSYAIIAPSVVYLHQHFTDPSFSVSILASISHISEVYFRKLFKKEFEISPIKYLARLRIRHAEALMSEGYYSLKEIAVLSGYNDYAYFSTEFKRMKGVSPSQYWGKK